MRPFRCSSRLGFHGTSKWNRSAQWFCRFTPSRAASVAMSTRSGCLAGSLLNARFTSSRVLHHAAVEWHERVRLPTGRQPGAKLLFQIALGVPILREDQDALVLVRLHHSTRW